MIGEWLSDMRTYFVQRLKNPVLAPFSVAWFVSNWKLVSFLLFSYKDIEAKIVYVEENYLNVSHLLGYPMAFALTYALLLPWMHLGIEWIQDKANLQRRKNRIISDTAYLKASVGHAEAQANLNQILAQDEITRRQQEELKQLRERADEVDSAAQARIDATEAELKSQLQNYEALREVDNEKSVQQQVEVDRLSQQLKAQRKQAAVEQENAQIELREREKELETRLANINIVSSPFPDFELEDLLLSRPYRLFHNPKAGPKRSKIIIFGSEGRIGEGRNNNEYRWRIAKGKLELIQQNGNVHSRFYFLPPSRIFVHTGDKDTPSARGQYIIPEPTVQSKSG